MNVFGRFAILSLGLALSGAPLFAQWTQWGGPNRDFQVPGTTLSPAWPAGGPEIVWERPLGIGHSAILVDGSRLYTMYGKGYRETVIALEADTGKTLWEHAYDVGYQPEYDDYKGPHATPLVVENRLFTIGIDFKLKAFDKSSGKVLWQRDLLAEYKPKRMQSGYAASPVVHENVLILPVGGKGQGAMGFDIADGRTLWQTGDFKVSHASPILIECDGEPWAILNLWGEIAALDPRDGRLLWRHALPQNYDNVAFTPIWLPETKRLLTTYPYGSSPGFRSLAIGKTDGKVQITEQWHNRKFRPMHGNAVLVEETLYGTTGWDPGFFTAVNVKEGKTQWKVRLPKANLLHVNGLLLILDEDGTLTLAEPSSEAFKPLAKAEMLTYPAWTVPTLVDKRLYVRDFKKIMAIDLP
jgi:outer membrane protein assembly factor BamB